MSRLQNYNVAKVRDEYVRVPKNLTADQVFRIFSSFSKGLFVMCPNCKRLDINPYEHFESCDPIAEDYRREASDHAWSKS